MTQVSIQTTGFELTQALSNTCQQAAAKLALSEAQGEKLEIFLSLEGKGDAKQTSAKIKITTPEQEIFVVEKGNDLYQAIREGCKKARQQYHERQK